MATFQDAAGAAHFTPPLMIPDDGRYPRDLFILPHHYHASIESVLIPHGLIQDRVEAMASAILNHYRGKTVHLICVLKGGSIFFSDLMRAMNSLHSNTGLDYIPYTMDFIRVSSYEGTESTGTVKVDLSYGDLSALNGRHILFVEDIIDTGLTMVKLQEYFRTKTECSSMETATLLEKRTSRSNGYRANYAGFSIPDAFVIGYGLDYNEVFRDMRHICVISEEGIRKYSGKQ